MNTLPTETLCQIFSYLGRADLIRLERVDRRSRAIVDQHFSINGPDLVVDSLTIAPKDHDGSQSAVEVYYTNGNNRKFSVNNATFVESMRPLGRPHIVVKSLRLDISNRVALFCYTQMLKAYPKAFKSLDYLVLSFTRAIHYSATLAFFEALEEANIRTERLEINVTGECETLYNQLVNFFFIRYVMNHPRVYVNYDTLIPSVTDIMAMMHYLHAARAANEHRHLSVRAPTMSTAAIGPSLLSLLDDATRPIPFTFQVDVFKDKDFDLPEGLLPFAFHQPTGEWLTIRLIPKLNTFVFKREMRR